MCELNIGRRTIKHSLSWQYSGLVIISRANLLCDIGWKWAFFSKRNIRDKRAVRLPTLLAAHTYEYLPYRFTGVLHASSTVYPNTRQCFVVLEQQSWDALLLHRFLHQIAQNFMLGAQIIILPSYLYDIAYVNHRWDGDHDRV